MITDMYATSSIPLMALKALAGNKPAQLDAFQAFLAAHLHTLTSFWIALWGMTALVLLWLLWRQWRQKSE